MKKNRRFYLTDKAWMFRDVSWASLFLFLLISTNMATIEGENISTKASSSSSTVTSSSPSTSPGFSTSTPKTMTDWKAFRTKPGLPQARSKKPTTMELSKAFDDVMKTYDKKFRPKYGEKALEIELNFIVLSFGHIREVEMEYEVDLYFLQLWEDERFNVPGINHENATIELIGSMVDPIWVPDTIFINSKKSNFHHVTLENRFMTVNLSTGEIVYHARITMTGACHMNLRYYPFDQQICYIAMESYGHEMLDIKYKWFNRGCNESCDEVFIYERNLANFDITKAVKTTEKTTYHTAHFSSATGKFVFKRRTPYFLLQIYLPCVLIVMVSWASFWIHEEAVPARAAICVTTILTIITMLGVVNVNMPKVSYVKAVDFYLFISFLMVFLSLVEYIIVLNIETFCRNRKQRKRYREIGNDKKHSVVVMVDPSDYQTNDYQHCNGYHTENHSDSLTRKRPQHKNRRNYGRKTSLFTFKLNNNHAKNSEHTAKDRQEELLEELLRLKEPSYVDVVSRFLFPLAFAIFNLCYWLIYLDQSHISYT